jgi:hypothetical protein
MSEDERPSEARSRGAMPPATFARRIGSRSCGRDVLPHLDHRRADRQFAGSRDQGRGRRDLRKLGDAERSRSFVRRHRQRGASALRPAPRSQAARQVPSARLRPRNLLLVIRRRVTHFRARCRSVDLRGDHARRKSRTVERSARELCGLRALVSVRRHQLAFRLVGIPADPRRPGDLRRHPREQGPNQLHGPVRRFGGADRNRHSDDRHGAQHDPASAMDRRHGVDRNRAGACGGRDPACAKARRY